MSGDMIKKEETQEYFCLHCGDVFPASQLKVDILGNKQGCGSKKHPDCDGAGFDVDLHPADSEFSKGCLENIARRAAMSEEELLREQKERLEDERKWFFEKYQKTLNKSFSNRKGARKEKTTLDAILKFQEAESMQADILRCQRTVFILRQFEAPSVLLLERAQREEEKKAGLQKLLSRKSYRDSINLVFSDILDLEKIEKFKKKTAMALHVSLHEAEDIYKIGRRALGSAYSGKSQR
jgi:AraC-like DNA-binding protein